MPNWLSGCLVLTMLFVIVLGSVVAWVAYSIWKNGTTPVPVVTTIEDAAKSRWRTEPASFRAMAAQVRAGTLKSDGASLGAAFAADQDTVNSRLETAVQAGDVAANLEKIATVQENIMRGVK